MQTAFARALAAALAIAVLPSWTLAQQGDPPVPADRDPGGPAIALISTGIDYTLPQIAARLARDGEGDLIGWDFADGDNRPFDPFRGMASARWGGDGTALASLILALSGSARLVVVRISVEETTSLARALAFVARTPARVIVMAPIGGARQDWEVFRQAAEHFTQLLIVVRAASRDDAATGGPNFPGGLGLANVHVAVPGPADEGLAAVPGFGGASVRPSPEAVAAIRFAIRAADASARFPGLTGAALRELLPRD